MINGTLRHSFTAIAVTALLFGSADLTFAGGHKNHRGLKKAARHAAAHPNRAASLDALASPDAPLANVVWDGGAGGGTAWLTAANWAGDVLPSTTDVAQFDVAGTSTTIGINMAGATNNGANNEAVGAIELLSTRNHIIGNSSSTAAGTFTLNGATVNSIANVILRNASTFLLTLQNNGGGTQAMDVALGNVASNNINIDGTGGITISSVIKNGAGNAIILGGAGSGALTLSGANTYTGGTTVISGRLLVTNTTGSGTGTGAVQVNAGTFGGTGSVSGAVTIGDGVGSGDANISPGTSVGTLTMTSTLSLASDAVYVFELNSTAGTADQIVANGVSLNSAASISIADLGAGVLGTGTTFVIINNTAGSAISGTFSNLSEGQSVVVGANTFQASYVGGTGNDLTLTVTSVPEPATSMLIGVGLLLVAQRFIRRKTS